MRDRVLSSRCFEADRSRARLPNRTIRRIAAAATSPVWTDTPHRFTFNGSWQLPFFKNRRDWMGQTIGGWQLSGVVKLAHGTPFTVIDTGTGDINYDGFSENRPVLLDPSILGSTIDNPDTSESYAAALGVRPRAAG
jgi:hypothetical protein